MNNSSLPVIGFCAFSGTGKTTLIERLIPYFKDKGLSVAVIKHGHHTIDLDTPGKDTHRFREAGAEQVILCSNQTLAVMTACESSATEPDLDQALSLVNPHCTDLVIIEGFKSANYPKIELYRQQLGQPYLFVNDPQIIAIASDKPINSSSLSIPQLDSNNIDQMIQFILNTLSIKAR